MRSNAADSSLTSRALAKAYFFPQSLMALYRVIYPLYRLEASSQKDALATAEKFLHENLHLIRVERDSSHDSIFKRIVTGK